MAEAVEAARDGRGSIVYLEGEGGLGKTRLLRELERRAEAAGLAVLRARGHDFESELAFGLVLQLFQARVARAPAGEREAVLAGAAALAAPLLDPAAAGSSPADAGSLLHGLFWLTSNLADAQPLLLSVDDAHMGDELSLRYLLYLAQRVEDLPVLVAVAGRPVSSGPAAAVLPRLRRHATARTLRPRPLSAAGVGWLVAEAGFAGADAEFVAACAESSGGNPLYLHELLVVLQRTSSGVDAAAVRNIGPRAVAESIYLALARLDEGATALARAVAILGPDASMRAAATLAKLPEEDAVALAAELATAGVFAAGAQLDFAHPILRSAVYEDLQPVERAWGHARAAATLAELGASPDRVAGHLLASEPVGEPWAADALSRAGVRALEQGDPRAASRLLRRALREPAEGDEQARLLLALGRAEAAAGEGDAPRRFEEACDAATEPGLRATILRELARGRNAAGDLAGARATYARALECAEGDLAAQVQAEDLMLASLDPESRAAVAERVDALLEGNPEGTTPAERQLLGTAAVHELLRGAPRERVLALAERSLGGLELLRSETVDGLSFYAVTTVLFAADEFERGEELLDEAVAEAARTGSVHAYANASFCRAWPRLHLCRPTEAVADAEAALAAQRYGWAQFLAGAYGAVVHGLIDLGRCDEAEARIAEAEALGFERDLGWVTLADARGRLHAIRGRHAEAVEDFLAAGALTEGVQHPVIFAAWRSSAALSLAELGDRGRARELAEEELALSRKFGSVRGEAVALRALGAIEGDLALLEESARRLDGSQALLERCRSLVALGCALREAGRSDAAREALRAALDVADRGGPSAIADRARRELSAAGARPRRARTTGAAALTPSELRVAQMAASGRTNREIAEELFVTVKAVKYHLGNAYRKLGIAAREELGAALGGHVRA